MKEAIKSFTIPFSSWRSWGLGMMETGWGNGYVVIPKGHPYYGQYYDAVDIYAHGNLTFSQDVESIIKSGANRHFIETLEREGITEGWVFGFDTAHYGDTQANWNEKRVKEETERVKKQLIDAIDNPAELKPSFMEEMEEDWNSRDSDDE